MIAHLLFSFGHAWLVVVSVPGFCFCAWLSCVRAEDFFSLVSPVCCDCVVCRGLASAKQCTKKQTTGQPATDRLVRGFFRSHVDSTQDIPLRPERSEEVVEKGFYDFVRPKPDKFGRSSDLHGRSFPESYNSVMRIFGRCFLRAPCFFRDKIKSS